MLISDNYSAAGQNNSVLTLEPIKSVNSKITAIYSPSSGDITKATAMYKFDVSVDDDLSVSFSEIIPEPSFALAVSANDGSKWNIAEHGDKIRVLEGMSNVSEGTDALVYYFPIVPVSPGETSARFVLTDYQGSVVKSVVYIVKVSDDLSVSLRVK